MSIFNSILPAFVCLFFMVLAGCSSSSSSVSNNAIETCYDVRVSYLDINQNQVNQLNNLCTTREHGGGNGLGVYRYLKFSLLSTSNVSVQVVRTSGLNFSDPDLRLFKNGVELIEADSPQNFSESFITNLDAGDYVVELSEFFYVVAANKNTPTLNDSVSAFLLKDQSNLLPSAIVASSELPCTTGNDKFVSGTVTFDRVQPVIDRFNNKVNYDYSNITELPVQQAVVEVICNGLQYDQTVTDAIGDYSLNFPAGQPSLVRVRAQLKQSGSPSWDFSVVDNTSPDQQTYLMDSQLFTENTNVIKSLRADSGWTIDGSLKFPGILYEGRFAAPFAILDSVRKSKDKVLALEPTAIFPPLNINWSVLNTTSRGDISRGQIETSFFFENQIYLLGAKDNDTDEYDEHVIIHEWGHYFEYNFSRSDSVGGPHTGGDILDVRVAFGEGFGNAFSAMVTDDPEYIDVSGPDQAYGFSFNIDRNDCVNPGWYSECSVQSILYDLYDSTGVADDDNLGLGFGPIYNVLTVEQKNTAAFTSIFSFIKSLKDQSRADAIDVLVGRQMIEPIQDVYGSSQLNNNPGDTSKLPLYQSY